MDTQQQMLIEQRIANDAKSTFAAYALWFLFGGFAAHRFYLGHTGSAIAMLLITVVGVFTLFPLIITAVWVIVDAFLIPGMVQQHKDGMRQKLAMNFVTSSQSRVTSTS
jgi:TM2 domain-containing membrane protein YozV